MFSGIRQTVAPDSALNTMLRRVVVAHGYTAHPKKHWFPWLRGKLQSQGIELIVPQLPNTDNPVKSEWVDKLSEVCILCQVPFDRFDRNLTLFF